MVDLGDFDRAVHNLIVLGLEGIDCALVVGGLFGLACCELAARPSRACAGLSTRENAYQVSGLAK